MKDFEKKLRDYARLLVRCGVNIHQGQTLVIRSILETADLARLCVEEGYRAGAKEVIVDWHDDAVERAKYLYADDAVFDEFSARDREVYEIGLNENGAMIELLCADPRKNEGVDPNRLQRFRRAKMAHIGPLYDTMGTTGTMCTCSPPYKAWAKTVLPVLPENEAMEKLWEVVFRTLRIDGVSDPIVRWEEHFKEMRARAKLLTARKIRKIHYSNSLGTDLEIGFPAQYTWEAVATELDNGVTIVENMPTEEIFTSPNKDEVNGIVYGSIPLYFFGSLVENFWFRFENGKVVDFGASKGREVLESLLNTDEGAKYLGEVALVPYDSPIRETGYVFCNSLYDENASCHLALGTGFDRTIPKIEGLNHEEMLKTVNKSALHCDFMIGTADLQIVGETWEGREITIFKDGNFMGEFADPQMK